MHYKMLHATYNDADEVMNGLSADGYEIFNILITGDVGTGGTNVVYHIFGRRA